MANRYPGLDLGIPTLLQMPDAESCAAFCARHSLQFIELNMNLPGYQTDTVDENALKKASDAHGVYFTLHLDENMNPCDCNPLVRDAYVQTTLFAIALAKRLQMPVINMHLHEGVYFTLPTGKVFLYDQYLDMYLEKMLIFRNRCEAAIGGSGILVCVENTNGYRGFARQAIDLLLESPVFALTLDVGHAYCEGRVDGPFILERQARLRHMHLHDATESACHLPFGLGKINLAEKIALAKAKNCRAVIEVKTMEGLLQTLEGLHDCL